MNQTGKRMTDMQAHLYICRAIFPGNAYYGISLPFFTHSIGKNTSERHLPTIGFSDADGGV
ncbi:MULTISPECIES: RAxF-45 family protein [Bacillus]|jgi:hypothetical protein|uniref:RAxF-45 family protein n=1 Tax=Bacillus TaxID=1386 RepID=UPI0006719C94|nr:MULTISPECIES: RAxF-45 family protein [Bacillus]AKQ72150.1 hypothetical protein MUY_001018 [Bacillus licheniformis WX-02]ARC62088.1 hypothetical protein BaDB11_03524 [Bacillus licheniformis]MCD2488610.1 hypothetical protein [Bacillus licheniformis]MCD2523737.1 hypothetical protein [Bacillus licheniformis]MCP8973561.1 hypothetical protein [Bacillus licheniformis]